MDDYCYYYEMADSMAAFPDLVTAGSFYCQHYEILETGTELQINYVPGSQAAELAPEWFPAQSWCPVAAEPAFWHVVVEGKTGVVSSVTTDAEAVPGYADSVEDTVAVVAAAGTEAVVLWSSEGVGTAAPGAQ